MKTTDTDLTCPFCESAQLELRTHTASIQHDGKPLAVDGMEYCECPACGGDPILTDQIRRNESRVADAKRRSMGLLTGEQIKRVRTRLQLTQREASELFGGGANSFSKYERGDVLQSAAMDLLLRMLATCPELLALVRSMKEPSDGQPARGEWVTTSYPIDCSAEASRYHLPQVSAQTQWQAVA